MGGGVLCYLPQSLSVCWCHRVKVILASGWRSAILDIFRAFILKGYAENDKLRSDQQNKKACRSWDAIEIIVIHQHQQIAGKMQLMRFKGKICFLIQFSLQTGNSIKHQTETDG